MFNLKHFEHLCFVDKLHALLQFEIHFQQGLDFLNNHPDISTCVNKSVYIKQCDELVEPYIELTLKDKNPTLTFEEFMFFNERKQSIDYDIPFRYINHKILSLTLKPDFFKIPSFVNQLDDYDFRTYESYIKTSFEFNLENINNFDGDFLADILCRHQTALGVFEDLSEDSLLLLFLKTNSQLRKKWLMFFYVNDFELCKKHSEFKDFVLKATNNDFFVSFTIFNFKNQGYNKKVYYEEYCEHLMFNILTGEKLKKFILTTIENALNNQSLRPVEIFYKYKHLITKENKKDVSLLFVNFFKNKINSFYEIPNVLIPNVLVENNILPQDEIVKILENKLEDYRCLIKDKSSQENLYNVFCEQNLDSFMHLVLLFYKNFNIPHSETLKQFIEIKQYVDFDYLEKLKREKQLALEKEKELMKRNFQKQFKGLKKQIFSAFE